MRTMPVIGRSVWLVIACVLAAASVARGQTLDDFESGLKWKAIPSDGVNATVSIEKAGDGNALRIDYDFAKGMGFVVVRREMTVDVPESYRFSFRVRGEGLANNFEFKLVEAKQDASGSLVPGDDVWWVNKFAYDWPTEWRRVAYRNRHIGFAWGPGGGKSPLRKVAAIEFAVAASKGGKGTVWIDDLKLEAVADVSEAAPAVRSGSATRVVPRRFGETELCEGVDVSAETGQSVELEFPSPREIGAIVLEVDGEGSVDFATSMDGEKWDLVRNASVRPGLSWVRTPGAEAKAIRITFVNSSGPNRAIVRVLGPSVGDDANALLRVMSTTTERGFFPRYVHGEATSWTVIGLPGGEHEALLSADGQVELSKGGFAIEPFVQILEGREGRILSWDGAEITHHLDKNATPFVTLAWPGKGGPVTLRVEAKESGTFERPAVVARYHLQARSGQARILVAARPMQSLPPSQWLNVVGGFSPIREIETKPDASTPAMVVNGVFALLPLEQTCAGMAVSDGVAGGLGGSGKRMLAWGRDLPMTQARAEDRDGMAWGVLATAWQDMASESEVRLHLAANLRPIAAGEDLGDWKKAAKATTETSRGWAEALGRVPLIVPPSARAIEETWRSQQRMIMVNADGPAYQPGSRTYERAWIRDGASIGTAMCFTGHVESMKSFIEWYAKYQYENGKVPCVVDHRGPDPVPEHDSHGEFIHCLATVYRFTGDKAFVEKHWKGVMGAVSYMDSTIAERSTDAYRTDEIGSEERGFRVPKKAFFGLVPESISHEGYSAKPMHSHWDGFWTVRGFKDAAFLAGVLGKPEVASLHAKAAAYRANMASSVSIANAVTGATWVPGCVELGDFDATSTAVAVWPCEEWNRTGGIPVELFEATFERYWAYFESRRKGEIEWKDYTPYEVRVIGAMLRLADRDPKWLERAHVLNDWFLADQRPAGWRQWGEVVYRDKKFAGFIGDYPHTWVGADYLNSVRAIFLDEEQGDDGVERLVLGRGISKVWLAEAGETGVGIGSEERGAPTWFGDVSYRVRWSDGGVTWEIRPALRAGLTGTPLVLRMPMEVAGVEAEGCEVARRQGGAVELKGPYAPLVRVRVRF